MIPLFDWEEDSYEGGGNKFHCRKLPSGEIIAKVELAFEKPNDGYNRQALPRDIDEKVYSGTITDSPHKSWNRYLGAHRKRLSQIKQWADKELHRLGYRLVENKYKVML